MNTNYKSFLRFMIKNGILSIGFSSLIILSIYAMIGKRELNLITDLSVFIFVLMIITVFFFIIYQQGHKLRSEQRLLSNVFDHISDGILVLNENFEIIKSNPAAHRILNKGQDHFTLDFCSFCSNYSGLSKLCEYGQCFLKEEIQGVRNLIIKDEKGESVTVSVSMSSYIDLNKERVYILLFKEAEEARIAEQRNISMMITRSIMQAQEKERVRISRELHDGIGQSLYSVLLQIEMLESKISDDEEDQIEIQGLKKTLLTTIEDIRYLSSELRPSILDDMGLIAAIQNYIHNYRTKYGIRVNFYYDGSESRLHTAVETSLYRLVQEALTNAAKYAHTERIDLIIFKSETLLKITIRDFGEGFEIRQTHQTGVGLYSMEERVHILGGEFALVSELNKGTTISISIPIVELTLNEN